ncbi:helix-turn-helix transcriptional regulator [Thioclava nitratireducens]|uniref:helix-turn-helix transcriptional regulator n=1 Tax=Thioclava nitratireducens TaxID=1915078 RepID=UPI002480E430|nr:helix-turn-helix transcriptional regulator [Thioclava nitratireducens]WGT48628.1 helix-turn-helix transcriptional regulator [Thioclava nitratireducens]
MILGLETMPGAGNFVILDMPNPELRRAFAEEMLRPDGWAQRLRGMEVGRVYDDGDLGAEAVNGGPIRQILRRSNPPKSSVAGVLFERGDRHLLLVEIHYPRHLEAEMRRPLKEFLARLARQLDVARRIMEVRQRLDAAERLSSNLLEILPFSVVLCNERRTVCQMNGRARAILRNGRALQLSPDATLRLADPAVDEEFATLVQSLQGSLRQHVAIMTVPRNSGEPREILTVIRLAAGEALGLPRACANGGPNFAVIYEDLDIPLELDQDFLWRLFGMNAKEADLALALLAGESIGELATRRRVSKETLRNQLAAVMRKTETSRQQELVALLSRLAAINATA